jgi:translation initiation factor 1 (eIF-1/SUI1)
MVRVDRAGRCPNTIELQGDQRERIRGLLEEKGIAVKG